MNRSLKLSILVALTLSTTQALALGLGRIHVKSALDKPLVAEIPLRTDYPGEASKLEVTLASSEQFARAGLDRMSLSVPLKFKVTTNKVGQKIILVTSDQPVRESYLDFLIQVSWPKGQLLREYTVLLDPPGTVATAKLQSSTSSSQAAPAKPRQKSRHTTRKLAQHKAAAPAPAPAAEPAAAPAAAPAPAPAAPAPSSQMQSGNYGPVTSGQTLWGIARKVRSSDISVNQMMVALKSSNPDAFYKDNINALKSGAVLRIPSHDQVLAKTAATATAEVARQNQSWSAAAPSKPTMMASAGRNAAATSGKPGAVAAAGGKTEASGDELKLVPPKAGGESTGARAGAAKGSSKVSVDEMHQDLSRAREALSSAKQETSDLQTRLKSLKDIQDKNDRLMSLKNAEIAELQNKLAAAGKPVPAVSAANPAMAGSVASSASSASMAMAGSAMQPAAAGSAAQAAVASTSAAAMTPGARQSKPEPKAATSQVKHPSPAAPWFTALWVKIAAAVIIVVLLIAFVLGRRKRKPGAAGAAGSSLADQFGDSPLGHDHDDVDEGSLDQEQEELLRELAENPDDVGLHLELVSLYYARRDVERFESAAEAMYTHISDPGDPEWQDVVAMGEELAPDYPLFANADPEAVAAAHADQADASDAYGMDVSDEPEHDLEAPETWSTDEPVSEPAHDDDLSPESQPEEIPEAPSEEDFDALPPLAEDESPEAEIADDDSDLIMLDEDEDEGVSDSVKEPARDDSETPIRELKPFEPGSESEQEAEPDFSAGSEPDVETQETDAPVGGFGGDAVDTKIDLARAYMDMGDPDGARAMLEEVQAEGSQMQREVAQKLLDEID